MTTLFIVMCSSHENGNVLENIGYSDLPYLSRIPGWAVQRGKLGPIIN